MSGWITDIITQSGYLGIFLLMLLESIFPPIPSELIIPFAGFSAAEGNLNVVGVIVTATLLIRRQYRSQCRRTPRRRSTAAPTRRTGAELIRLLLLHEGGGLQ